jgi:hypothetical protein
MFGNLMRDKITLVRANGEVVREGISASVQRGKIITQATDLHFENGDHLLRTLPSNMVEEYLVLDTHFANHPSMGHWSLDVRRTDQPPAAPHTIIAHIQGNNSRVLINSTDYSTNIAAALDNAQLQQLVLQVRANIGSLPQDTQATVASALSVIEEESNKPTPDVSRLNHALNSMKTACEGAAGNLVATGIVGLIAQLFQ